MSPSTSPQPARSIAVNATGLSDVGRVRKENEDAFNIDAILCMFIVADGMGGHLGGSTASNMAVELLPHLYRERIAQSKAPAPQKEVVAALGSSLGELSRRIYAAGRQKSELRGMGTTLAVLLVNRGHAHITHLGDSRAYVLRNRTLHQLTQDHSVASDLIRDGRLSPDQASNHLSLSQLTSFVGIRRPVLPDVAILRLRVGDRLLLCTDGIWSAVPQAEMRDILAVSSTPKTACRRLIACGNGKGGQDNLTALVVDYGEEQTLQPSSKKSTVKVHLVTTQPTDLGDEI